jgi:hypothetical protein
MNEQIAKIFASDRILIIPSNPIYLVDLYTSFTIANLLQDKYHKEISILVNEKILTEDLLARVQKNSIKLVNQKSFHNLTINITNFSEKIKNIKWKEYDNNIELLIDIDSDKFVDEFPDIELNKLDYSALIIIGNNTEDNISSILPEKLLQIPRVYFLEEQYSHNQTESIILENRKISSSIYKFINDYSFSLDKSIATDLLTILYLETQNLTINTKTPDFVYGLRLINTGANIEMASQRSKMIISNYSSRLLSSIYANIKEDNKLYYAIIDMALFKQADIVNILRVPHSLFLNFEKSEIGIIFLKYRDSYEVILETNIEIVLETLCQEYSPKRSGNRIYLKGLNIEYSEFIQKVKDIIESKPVVELPLIEEEKIVAQEVIAIDPLAPATFVPEPIKIDQETNRVITPDYNNVIPKSAL